MFIVESICLTLLWIAFMVVGIVFANVVGGIAILILITVLGAIMIVQYEDETNKNTVGVTQRKSQDRNLVKGSNPFSHHRRN